MNDMFTGLILQHLELWLEERDLGGAGGKARHKGVTRRTASRGAHKGTTKGP